MIICLAITASSKCQDSRPCFIQANTGTESTQIHNTFATPYHYNGLGWYGGLLFGIENEWNKRFKIEVGSGQASSDVAADLFDTNQLDFRKLYLSFDISRPVVNISKMTVEMGLELTIQAQWMDFDVENLLRPVQLNEKQNFTFVGVGVFLTSAYQLLPSLQLGISLVTIPAGFVNYPSPTNPDLALNNESKILGMDDNYYFSVAGNLEYEFAVKWSLVCSSEYEKRRFFDSYELSSTGWLNKIGMRYRLR